MWCTTCQMSNHCKHVKLHMQRKMLHNLRKFQKIEQALSCSAEWGEQVKKSLEKKIPSLSPVGFLLLMSLCFVSLQVQSVAFLVLEEQGETEIMN